MIRKLVLLAALALALGGLSAGLAVAASGGGGGGDDDGTEVPITEKALDRASAVALEATGGGTVTETEVGDEESFYEVEVTLDDGSESDVQLDENFNVVSSAPDGPDGPNDN